MPHRHNEIPGKHQHDSLLFFVVFSGLQLGIINLRRKFNRGEKTYSFTHIRTDERKKNALWPFLLLSCRLLILSNHGTHTRPRAGEIPENPLPRSNLPCSDANRRSHHIYRVAARRSSNESIDARLSIVLRSRDDQRQRAFDDDGVRSRSDNIIAK